MIIPIISYLVMYGLDMCTSIYTMKKNAIAGAYESNQVFKNLVNAYGSIRGAILYSLTAGIQLLIINLISFTIAYKLVLGVFNWEIIFSLMFTFMAIAHTFGMLSNLLALLKFKPIKNETKQITYVN